MKNRYAIRFGSLFAIALVVAAIALSLAVAQDVGKTAPPPVTISQLAGTWTATLSGVTGCGTSTLQTTFTLDATGNGTQSSAVLHTVGCGDVDHSGESAQIQSLRSNGNGFIALGCGVGCGFGFKIQVARNLQVFNMGAQAVSGNYLAGVAVHR
jgi:hypothetical protein